MGIKICKLWMICGKKAIFPIEISKNFVGKSKMENVKTLLVWYCYFVNTLFVALRIKLSEAAWKVS